MRLLGKTTGIDIVFFTSGCQIVLILNYSLGCRGLNLKVFEECSWTRAAIR